MEKTPKFDYSDIHFKENGKLKLIIVVGTRPEIIRLAAVITKCREYFDVILAHTGQNYDYNLNGIFFKDLKLAEPEVYMDAVGDDLGATCGNIINCSYKLFAQTRPDAVLVLGDTNSCLSVIGAKRLHIPIFHMEAGNRCKDECLPEETNRRIVDIISDVNMAYSEHARRYLAECGLPKERTYVTGSPMAEVLHQNLVEIEASDIHKRLGLEKGRYILLSAHREENIAVAKSRNSHNTKICCTRYGNVMCSRGSVIPLWIEQIRSGNPITLTEPKMTRFIMSLEEAVDLVLFAFEHGHNGDILVQKAPACTIQTQAEAVCDLFGGKKEDIKVIGIRHGEKMYETLLTKEECAKAEDMGNFYRVPADNRDLNYDQYFTKGDVKRATIDEFNSDNTYRLNLEETTAKIGALEYIQNELNGVENLAK